VHHNSPLAPKGCVVDGIASLSFHTLLLIPTSTHCSSSPNSTSHTLLPPSVPNTSSLYSSTMLISLHVPQCPPPLTSSSSRRLPCALMHFLLTRPVYLCVPPWKSVHPPAPLPTCATSHTGRNPRRDAEAAGGCWGTRAACRRCSDTFPLAWPAAAAASSSSSSRGTG